ncbi:MAG: transcriptional regulator [Deltaproteobacteria bacterium]|nr:transcriptional regulator [Deltaproteobacteria bacterium]
METHLLKLITIIAEDVLENEICENLSRLGAQGYTITKAHGKGSHRIRSSEWEGENVRIESITSSEVALQILQYLSETYFKQFGVIAYLSDVEVMREKKYIK